MNDILWKVIEEELTQHNAYNRGDWINANILGDSICDIGGAWGDGFTVWKNSHKGPFLLVEANKTLIDEGLSRENQGSRKGLYEVINMTAGSMKETNVWNKIPKPDKSYDTVIMGDMLEHNNVMQALYILADGIRLAKKRVIITTPNGEWIGRQPQCVIAGHFTFFTPAIFRSILDHPDVLEYWYTKFHPEWSNTDIWWKPGDFTYTIDESTCYVLLKLDKNEPL